jgi:ABC-type nitrate/sulfonate/bicarbonate transport system permease component
MGQIAPGYVNLIRTYGGNTIQVYTLVKIPYAMPALFSGLKVAATYSISGAVVGEWVASQAGIGYYLLRVKNSYALDKMFASVLVIILLSLMMNGLITLLQRLCLPHLYRKNHGRNRK